MRILLVGGRGYVAGLALPALRTAYAVRTFDLRPGADDHVVGDALDPAALRGAMDGVDAVVHCAIGLDGRAAFDVNVTSAHLTLAAAHEAGVRHAVYVSSLSVFDELMRPLDETTPPDATDAYGLSKRLGEQVCAAAVARWDLSVTVLRLAWPTPDEVWPAWPPWDRPRRRYAPDGTLIAALAGSDLGRALVAAVGFRDGFQLFHVTGGAAAGWWSGEKAARRLGWRPSFG